jgi:hypothetical protein
VYSIIEMDYERREEGYLNLGQYFDGGNAAKTWYRMTAPVVMRYYPGVRHCSSDELVTPACRRTATARGSSVQLPNQSGL